MKRVKLFVVLVFCICICVLAVSVSFAEVPGTLNYQGTLTTTNGVLINGTVTSITFRIYDQLTDGNLVWGPETHNNVTVTNGLFSCVLNNLSASVFSGGDRYISIQVDSDSEMSPRQKINSVPYSLKTGDGTPSGIIAMWSGAVNNIPAGWALCDGSNGTPDLKDRFIVGAGSGYAVGATGGEATHVLTIAEMPNHTHVQNAHTHIQDPHNHNNGTYQYLLKSDGSETNSDTDTTAGEPNIKRMGAIMSATATNQYTTATNQNTGGGAAHENRPPYYALAFIMKL